MCLAIPALIIEKDQMMVTVEIGGLTKQASVILLPDAKAGDYVLIHAGFAISLVDRREAQETLKMFDELLKGMADEPSFNSEPPFGGEPKPGAEPLGEDGPA